VGKFFLKDARRDIDKFEAVWLEQQKEMGFEKTFWDRMQDLKYYKKTLKKGRIGSEKHIWSILAHK